ncbi:MAG: hypothetical protein ABI693_17575, partial [Bryobacteraceae bacterium]
VRVVNRGNVPLKLYSLAPTPVNVLPGMIGTIAGTRTGGFSGDRGPAVAAMLNLPTGVALNAAGVIFVADYYNQRLRRIDPLTGIVATLAGTGVPGDSGDGQPSTAARLKYPCTVAFDKEGNVYIGQQQSTRVRKILVSTGIISTVAGLGGSDETGDGGPALIAGLSSPTGVALDDSNNLYIAEYNNARVRRVSGHTQIINTFAGSVNVGNDGPATAAVLNDPCGFCVDRHGYMLLTDQSNQMVRSVDTSGVIRRVAGTGIAGYNGDSILASDAQLSVPSDVQLDSVGNMYICDRGNSRVRKVDPQSGIISTVAGDGTSGYGGDWGAATSAQLNQPRAITIDAHNNLYIAELGSFRVRFVNLGSTAVSLYPGTTNAITVPPGVIVTIAGTGVSGSLGDGGPAIAAQVNSPRGVTTDSFGNVYITEGGRDPQNVPGPNVVPDSLIRKILAKDGTISTVAGTLTAGYNGDKIPATKARLNGPRNVSVDPVGNLYIADSLNNRIRFVDAQTNLITTAVGGVPSGFSGDGGPIGGAKVCVPRFVAVSGAAALYFTDSGNSRIRKVEWSR